ncbi:MAG: DUF4388 domain-containing protein [Deltaproteobacteria bacterium]|nr:DUF4388 domain-containing protein [Deltaproteobacteria bacterium]
MAEPADGWTLEEVLGVMDAEHRTGVLEAVGKDLAARVHLRNGYVVGIVRADSGSRWRLGDYLTESGAVTVDQIVAARREATKKGMDIEEALVKQGRISEDGLRRFADTYVLDELMPLFRVEELDFKFLEERPIPARFATPLPVSFVLREAERQRGHFDALRQRVGHPAAIYKRDSSVMGEVLGYEEPERGDTTLELSANARAVYFFINGERSVQAVSHAAALTLFDTYAAMNELLDAWLITVIAPLGDTGGQSAAVSYLPRVVTVLTWGIVAAVLALGADFAWRHIGTIHASATTAIPAAGNRVRDARMQLTHDALQLYRLHHGAFPQRLPDLVAAGYLPPRRRALLSDLRYAPVEDGYTLEPARPPRAPSPNEP